MFDVQVGGLSCGCLYRADCDAEVRAALAVMLDLLFALVCVQVEVLV